MREASCRDQPDGQDAATDRRRLSRRSGAWRRRTRRILPPGLAVIVGVLLGSFALAVPASAHAILVSSTPAQGTIVLAPPTQVVLQFTETVSLIPGKIRVIAPDNTRADENKARVSGDQVIIPMKPGGKHGTYLVTFRIISADSHPVGGAFTYSVVNTSTPPAQTGDTAVTSPLVSALFPIVRWIGYVGLVMMVGAVLVLALLWPQRLSTVGPVRVTWVGAALIAVATIGELAVQVPNVAGGFADVGSSDVQDVLSSEYGAAHLIRLGVLAAALFLLRPVLKGKGWGADRVLLAVLGAIGIATWSVSGHPYASSMPTLTIAADMIHVASMSVWLGGLLMLAIFLLPRANAAELSAIVPVWSRWAGYAVGALLVTGVAQVLVDISPLTAVFTTSYGQLVLAKVVLLGGVVLIASYSRRQVAPIAAKVAGAAKKLRLLVAAESVGVLAIIGVAAVLVQTTPARAVPSSTAVPSVQSAVLPAPSKLFTLTVDDSPATVGANEIHMYATTTQGQPQAVQQWTVTAALPAQGIEPIPVATLQLAEDHAIGEISLPDPGTWTFSFTLRTSAIDEDTVTTTFTIR
jgi:copper transport protein